MLYENLNYVCTYCVWHTVGKQKMVVTSIKIGLKIKTVKTYKYTETSLFNNCRKQIHKDDIKRCGPHDPNQESFA